MQLLVTFFVMHLSGYRNLLSGVVLVLLESAATVSVAAVEFDHKVGPLLVLAFSPSATTVFI
ncbi:MAG: hypothetical protein Ct9H300mP32_3030 [Verrucomicrobiota bacterium]|nr:MAG: hypothetical protein Ct9H300mP32_3030 [Verrucomicrobiota bacterium]